MLRGHAAELIPVEDEGYEPGGGVGAVTALEGLRVRDEGRRQPGEPLDRELLQVDELTPRLGQLVGEGREGVVEECARPLGAGAQRLHVRNPARREAAARPLAERIPRRLDPTSGAARHDQQQ